MSDKAIEIGDFWITKKNPIECEVIALRHGNEVPIITSYSAEDDCTDSCTQYEFLRDYEFLRKGSESESDKDWVCSGCNKPVSDCLCLVGDDVSSDIEWRCDDCGHKYFKGELKCKHCSVYESVKPKHSHYHKDVSQYDTIDVYAVCKIFDVQDTSGCLQHAIKKLLVTGKRGYKDRQTDIQNAIDTLNRLLELEHD